MLQTLNVAGRHGRVKVDFLVFLGWLGLLPEFFLRRQGFAHTRATLAGLGLSFGAGHELSQQLVSDFGVLKIHVKQLAEHAAVLFPADHDGFKRSA